MKDSGLGKGESKIVQSTEREDINSLGFVNAENINGGAFVNNTSEAELIEINFNNTNIQKRAKVDIYMVSTENDGSEPIDSRVIYPENRKINLRYVLPQDSVLGVKIYEEKQWYDIFDPIIPSN